MGILFVAVVVLCSRLQVLIQHHLQENSIQNHLQETSKHSHLQETSKLSHLQETSKHNHLQEYFKEKYLEESVEINQPILEDKSVQCDLRRAEVGEAGGCEQHEGRTGAAMLEKVSESSLSRKQFIKLFTQ